MRRSPALVLLVLTLLLAGCTSAQRPDVLPGRPDVDVDTAELREVKERIGMVDCAPGPADAPVEGGLPQVTLPCLGGGTEVDLASLRGPLVLNFWASWCPPCRQEMPALEAFSERYGDRVPILGMNVNDIHPDRALAMAEETGVTYPSLADPGGDVFAHRVFAIAQRGFPAFVFVAEDGTVAGVASGGVDSVAEIESLVDEHLGVRL